MAQRLTPGWRKFVTFVAIGLTLYHLVTSYTGALPHMQHRSLHFLLSAILIFLTLPLIKGRSQTRPAVYDIVLLVLLTAAVVNIFLNYETYLTYMVPLGLEGALFAIVTLVAVILGAYRTTGLVFPIMITVLLIYAVIGPYVPGVFAHQGFSWARILSTVYQQDNGAWGFLTGISATVVSIFLIFGAVLRVTGGGEAFVKLAYVLMGKRPGGPALVAVAASALFGMVSGSATANVAATGVFTIPMMKKVGYRPAFAGAVEAFASTGGQFTPPIMAATAFVMAEILGVSYLVVCALALIPCILYYASAFFHITSEAKKTGLKAVPKEDIPPAREIANWATLGPLFIPIVLVFYFLLSGWSIQYAVFWATVSAIVLRLFSVLSLPAIKKTGVEIVKALADAGHAVANLAMLLVGAQIAVTLINLTGVGIKVGALIMAAGQVHILIAIALTAVVVMIMGMGMPTTGAYIIGISTAGNALIWMGLDKSAVHLLTIYYAALSAITPPVCLANFVAESISGASFWSIAKIACGRLALIAYILPFLFIYNPDLLIIGRQPLNIAVSTLAGLLGVALMAQATSGFWPLGAGRNLNVPLRIVVAAGGALLLLPSWQARSVGIAISVLMAVLMWLRSVQEARRPRAEVGG